ASGNSSLISLHGNAGNDLFVIGNNGTLDPIHSKVDVTGGTSGFSTLFVNDQNKLASGLNYVVSATSVMRQDLASLLISFSQVQDVTVLGALFGGGSANVMYLTGQAAGTVVGLYGNGGNYAFSVQVMGTSGYNNVVLDGRSGSHNQLFVTDVTGGGVNHNAPSVPPTRGGVTTTYPNKSGAKTSVVQYNVVDFVFLNPNNG